MELRGGNDYTEAVFTEIGENAGRVGVRILYTGDHFFIHKSRLESPDRRRQGRWNPQDMKVSYPPHIPRSISFGCCPTSRHGHTTWGRGYCYKTNGFLFPREVHGPLDGDRMGWSVFTCSVHFWRDDGPRLRPCVPSMRLVVPVPNDNCHFCNRVGNSQYVRLTIYVTICVYK